MIEKMHKARSTTQNNRQWPSYKGFGVTDKWTITYIDQRLHRDKIEKLRLKISKIF